MKIEFLLQFIVPLTFLAIWALTSLLNRDAQPLPPRPGAGRPGPGPARGTVGGGFSPSTRGELAGPSRSTAPTRPAASTIANRTAPARWSSAPAQGRYGSAVSRAGDEGIVIIESETRSPQSSSSFSPSAAASSRASRSTGPAARRAARARSTPPAPIKPMEPERPRALTGLVGQSLAQKKARPLDVAPLSTPIAPITSAPLTTASLTPPPEIVRTAVKPAEPSLSINELRAMLASPKRLREVALLGELLQPPVTLRAPRRPR